MLAWKLMTWLETVEEETEIDVWYDKMNDDTYLVAYGLHADIDNPKKILI